MSNTALSHALMASQALPLPTAGTAVPDWVHLLPLGAVQTVDDRGPYLVEDADAIIAASMSEGVDLLIDLDHATDKLAPQGFPAPAHGWIKEMQSREDGIWGRVEWNKAGRALLEDRAYRGISPVIYHDAQNRVHAIGRASLVNRPNIRGIAALNAVIDPKKETRMSLNQRLAKMLGLKAEATDDEVVAALEAKLTAKKETAAAQSALTEIGVALGVEGNDPAAILNAAKTVSSDASTLVPALQSQVTELATELKDMKEASRKKQAEDFVDGEIANLRLGLNSANRDEFVAMHMENPERTEKLVGGFAVMSSSGRPQPARLATSLNAATSAEVSEKAAAYRAKMKAAGKDITFTQAVLAVSEGKQ
jgi:phage I-like protein